MASVRERLRPRGLTAAYVWEYAEGMEFLRSFWDEAAASDPRAAALDEGRRFPLCRTTPLASLFRAGGLAQVETEPLEIPTDFATFDDYWTPFLRGTGPAPSYVGSIDPLDHELLRERLRRRLKVEATGALNFGRARGRCVVSRTDRAQPGGIGCRVDASRSRRPTRLAAVGGRTENGPPRLKPLPLTC